MPRHKVINRREIPDPRLRNRLLNVSDEGMEAVNSVAAELNVSVATVVDSLLRYSTALSKELMLDLLVKDGHLTEAEAEHIEKNILGTEDNQAEKPPAKRKSKTGSGGGGTGKQSKSKQE